MSVFALIYLVAFISSAISTALTLPLWRRWGYNIGLVDEPGHRKIHSEPIALAGGLAVMCGIIIPLIAGLLYISIGHSGEIHDKFRYGIFKRFWQLSAICSGAIAMLGLGWFDDKKELNPLCKFAGQFFVAGATALAGVRITLFIDNWLVSFAITVLWILTITNAMNFLDNMNGLCAGLAAIGSAVFGIISAIHNQYLVASMCWLVAGAFIGFLPYNYPRASVFLGDAGSHLAGYLLSVMAILPHFYSQKHPVKWAVLTPLIILGVQLFDITQVVLRRIINRKPIYIGDTNHISHLLVRSGIKPANAVALIWLVSAMLGAVAIILNL